MVVFFAVLAFVNRFGAFSAESFLFLLLSPFFHVFFVVFSVSVFFSFALG